MVEGGDGAAVRRQISPRSGKSNTHNGPYTGPADCVVGIYSRCLSRESARFRLTCGPVFVLMGFKRVWSAADGLTVERSRKHIVNDGIPTTACVLRRVPWMLLVREFGRELSTHCRADSGAFKGILAGRDPTASPPRGCDA